MKTLEWKFPDRRRGMPPGPWDDEPDKMQWTDPGTGLACMVKRNPMGVWCGYVGVDDMHPWYGKSYSDNAVHEGDVHGGLTYSAACDGDEVYGICHVPDPGEPEPLWWFGFDCGHSFDLVPSMIGVLPDFDMSGTYRDLAYVRAEAAKLAVQIALAA